MFRVTIVCGAVAAMAFVGPLAGCSALLDWSDYTGASAGVPDASTDSALADDGMVDGASVDDGADAAHLDVGPDGAVEASVDLDAGRPPTCVVASCPSTCNVTVYFRSCCKLNGTCGCQSTIPSPGACM